MDGLAWTPRNVLPLLIAAVAMVTTLIRAVAAFRDRSSLHRVIRAQPGEDTPLARRVVAAGIRRELARMFKHFLTITIIASTFTAMAESPDYLHLRNWYAAAIGIVMAFNSVSDHFLQRYALRHFGC